MTYAVCSHAVLQFGAVWPPGWHFVTNPDLTHPSSRVPSCVAGSTVSRAGNPRARVNRNSLPSPCTCTKAYCLIPDAPGPKHLPRPSTQVGSRHQSEQGCVGERVCYQRGGRHRVQIPGGGGGGGGGAAGQGAWQGTGNAERGEGALVRAFGPQCQGGPHQRCGAASGLAVWLTLENTS